MGIRGSILNSLQVQDYSSRAQAWGLEVQTLLCRPKNPEKPAF